MKKAIDNLLHEGGIGIVLTAVMILLFLGQHAGNDRRHAVDSAFRAGGVHGHFRGRRHGQHHGARRSWHWPSRA